MLLSHIKQLLDHTISIDSFREAIKPEIDAYKESYRQKEVTIPVHLKEDIYYLFTNTAFETLQQLHLTGDLTEYEVSYICDALSLSEMTIYDNDMLAAKVESLVIYDHN
jgi:hypothetical protein